MVGYNDPTVCGNAQISSNLEFFGSQQNPNIVSLGLVSCAFNSTINVQGQALSQNNAVGHVTIYINGDDVFDNDFSDGNYINLDITYNAIINVPTIIQLEGYTESGTTSSNVEISGFLLFITTT